MKKVLIKTAILTALSIIASISATSVQAATLNFTDGVIGCIGDLGTPPDSCLAGTTIVSGSYWAFNYDGNETIDDAEKIGMNQLNGIVVDGTTIQSASGSHPGFPDGSENPDIDNPFDFLANTGMHFATSPISVLSNNLTGNVELDFSGWAMTWNGVPIMALGGDPVYFPSETGVATMSCTVDCSDGESYTLDFLGRVPNGDPSGIGGVPYALHLEGAISGTLPAAVPVPSAVWLFGSGLIGLISIAKRKKA